MSIDGVSGRTSYIGTSIIDLRKQLDDLTQQLASGKVSTTYAGQGANRGFALSLRAQVSSIDAFKDTATNVNTRLNVVNLALQGMADIGTSVKECGQHVDHRAQRQRSDLRPDHGAGGVLQCGVAAQQPVRRPLSVFRPYHRHGRDGAGRRHARRHGTQAGLKQLINERRQADQGVGNMAHLTVSSPPLTTTVTSLAEDGSSFGLKLGAVTSSLTGATVTQPTGAPPAVTVDLGAVNPNDGDKITFNFNLPDGTTEQIALTATTTNPPPDRLVPDRRRHRRDDGEPAGCVDVFDPDAERHRAGGRVGDRGFRQFLQSVGDCRRKRRQQPGHGAGADHRRHAAVRRRGDGFAGRKLCGGRYHHGQRHADHVRGLRRDRQPSQYHRQRPDPVGEDRFRSPGPARRRR